jgi:transcriptional regulator with XRE-family HTH domain
MTQIGDKIKKAREEKSISLKELSEKINIGQSTISEIETGKAKKPKADTLYKIALELGISFDYLMGVMQFKNQLEYTHSVNIAIMKSALTNFNKNSLIKNAVIYINIGNSDETNNLIKQYVMTLISMFLNNEELTDIELYELSYMFISKTVLGADGSGFVELRNGERHEVKIDFENIRKITLDLSSSCVAIDETFNAGNYVKYLYGSQEFISGINNYYRADPTKSTNSELNIYSPKTKTLLDELKELNDDDIEFLIEMVKRMKRDKYKD